MTLSNMRRLMISCTLLGIGSAAAQAPVGWVVAGSAPRDYDFTRDSSTASSGRYSALIAAKAGTPGSGFGTLLQTIDAEHYRTARCRLSGYLKTSDAARAQMWMRVDGPNGRIEAFDNMDSRPITGTTGWSRYEIVLDVPADSIDIAFGFLLAHSGRVWGDNFKLEKVAATVPLTAPATAPITLPKEPLNIDFENDARPGAQTDSIVNAVDVDVYDIFRVVNARYEHYTGFNDSIKYDLCGMHIDARAPGPTGNTLEWDLKVTVFLDGKTRVAGIAAGAFTRPDHSKVRKPRPPITALTIGIEGAQEPPGSANIGGAPNSTNGVVGMFPELYAEKWFAALDAGTPFDIVMTYQSGEHETVHARTLGGAGIYRSGVDLHGTGAPVRRCMEALVPPSSSPLTTTERQHPW